eukprot:scaffold559863_cov19-Prasinocladus_malaysianus.AAC.1
MQRFDVVATSSRRMLLAKHQGKSTSTRPKQVRVLVLVALVLLAHQRHRACGSASTGRLLVLVLARSALTFKHGSNTKAKVSPRSKARHTQGLAKWHPWWHFGPPAVSARHCKLRPEACGCA